MSSDSTAETLEQTLKALGADSAAIDSTIVRAAKAPDASASLPPIGFRARVDGSLDRELVALGELGRGGMGVVHRAQQRSLGREVAVKTTQSDDPASSEALVREARIAGSLEHPNVVPVHALGADADGSPILVMKKIEGVAWTELLSKPEHPAWAPFLAGHGDRQRANLEILIQIARALAFAHDRGVVHRDVKPHNVMLGRFGEVYLMDWGVALRLADAAKESRALVGTPAYMAPEMVGGDPTQVDPRTDVYLLGGTLFSVLTNQLPHAGKGTHAALMLAKEGHVPPIPASVPAELATLVKKSMAKERLDRVPTAEAFREALARHLVHRQGYVLADEARAAMKRADAKASSLTRASDIYRALAEARFGYLAAVKILPDDEALKDELDLCLTRLVEHEVLARSLVGARGFFAELRKPPAALEARVKKLEAELAQEQKAVQAFERHQREADLSPARRPLTLLFWALAPVILSIGAWLSWRAYQNGDQGFPIREAIAYDAGISVLIGAGVFVFRRRLFATLATRRATLLYVISILSAFGSDAVTFALGRPTTEAVVHGLTSIGFMALVGTATLLPKVWPAVPLHLLGTLLALRFPPAASSIALTVTLLDAFVFVRAFPSGTEGR